MGKKIERIAKDFTSVISGGASNKVRQTLNPDVPQPEETQVAPVVDDKAVRVANRRKAARRAAGGRAGTVLTQGDTLG